MTVNELVSKLDLEPICIGDGNLEVTGGYTGDLLSWVMGKAEEGDAWVTIMTNQNVAAVAVLTEVACVILAEGVSADSQLLERAADQGINLLRSDMGAYRLCAALSNAIGE